MILAHWHGDELAVLHLVKVFKLATMTSTSKDGHLIDFVIRKMGGATSRGSSTRGAVGALKGLVRLVRSGRIASMAVDGPRGPIYQVKPGVFELSRLTNAIIVPVGVDVSFPFIFKKSWNKAVLPLPFSHISMTFDQPLSPLEKGALTKDPKLAEKLREMLFLARKKASKLIAGNDHQ
ncbi:MAG: DUF374 domain-containing protein [Bdellovibrionales bacterium]|nr:DUF374 domain-containing protein [Bdellovibrionales bacterium]